MDMDKTTLGQQALDGGISESPVSTAIATASGQEIGITGVVSDFPPTSQEIDFQDLFQDSMNLSVRSSIKCD